MKSTEIIPPPATPFSANVTPFVFGDARHREIFGRLNVRGHGRNARVKTHRDSVGVIWNGQPFYWTKKGFYRGGAIGQRRPLQQLVWEQANRRRVPAKPHSVVCFVDGNRNNFTPENLVLKTKAEIGIGNQRHATMDWNGIAAKKAERRGQRETGLLLQKFNRGDKTLATELKGEKR